MQNRDLNSQVSSLNIILTKSKLVSEVLEKAQQLDLPNWYLGAGAVVQTVWNELHGYPLDHGIKDYDLVYFDEDTSPEAQDVFIQKSELLFGNLPVEVTNEARVHLWYKESYGKEIKQYTSTEDAINSWPTTCTSMGVRRDGEN